MKAKEVSMGMFCRVGWTSEILIIVHFREQVAYRSTRERPAVDPREIHNKKMSGITQRNLKNRTVLGKEKMIAGRANKQSKECSRTIM